MIPKFPVIELFDRLTIAKVKYRRTRSNTAELAFYQEQVCDYDLTVVQDLIDELEQIHDEIWDLEKELKSGVEHSLDLAEIGRRAIRIRDRNNRRVMIKNTMADRLQDPVREIKKDHLSE